MTKTNKQKGKPELLYIIHRGHPFKKDKGFMVSIHTGIFIVAMDGEIIASKTL